MFTTPEESPPPTPAFFFPETRPTTEIRVRYWDLRGRKMVTRIAVETPYVRRAQKLFEILERQHFPIAHLNPHTPQEGNFAQALAKNYSFFGTYKGEPVFILNPAMNPTFIRRGAGKPVFIYPAQGALFIVRPNRRPRAGVITRRLVKILKKNSFTTYIKGVHEAVGSAIFLRKDYDPSPSIPSILSKDGGESIADRRAVFFIEELDPAQKMNHVEGRLWNENCPISPQRLVDVYFTYFDFQGQRKQGRILVMDVLAPHLLRAFREMYRKKFPVEYHTLDARGRRRGGTGAYNCRPIRGGHLPSLHAYGLAVDINYLQNPYLGQISIESPTEPAVGTVLPPYDPLGYLIGRTHADGRAELLRGVMRRAGLPIWGGGWRFVRDFQHFQTTRTMARMLVKLSRKEGSRLFALSLCYPRTFAGFHASDVYEALITLYPQRFITGIATTLHALRHPTGESVFLARLMQTLQAPPRAVPKNLTCERGGRKTSILKFLSDDVATSPVPPPQRPAA